MFRHSLILAAVLCAIGFARPVLAQEPGDTIRWFFGEGGRTDSIVAGGVEFKMKYNYAVHVRPGQFALIHGWWKVLAYGHVLNENPGSNLVYLDLRNGNTRLEQDFALAPRLLGKAVLQLGDGRADVTISIAQRTIVEAAVEVPGLVLRPPTIDPGPSDGNEPASLNYNVITIRNHTGERLRVFVRYQDLSDRWITGNYDFAPGEVAAIDAQTRNRWVYFRAKSATGTWDGGSQAVEATDGRKYHQVNLGDKVGRFTYTFNP